MNMNDMILISVDDHIIEPPDTFKHVPAKYRDLAPRVVTADDGSDRWLYRGALQAFVGSSAVCGRSREERHLEPTSYKQLRKGTWDVDARIDDMSANGVLASLNFGSLTGFAGEFFLKGDMDVNLVCLQAYNDFLLEDWTGKHPGRFITACLLPLWNVNLAIAELKRVAAKGANAVNFPEAPAKLGIQTIHTGYWDPLFEEICKQDIAVCIHIGTGGGFRYPSMDSPADVGVATMNISLADCAADILFSHVLRKFPDLRIALSEGYMGWMPFFRERSDFVYEFHRFWTGQDFGNQKPSDVIRKHFLVCFTEDPVGVETRHRTGIETITWECDYPHADSTWPVSPERLWPSMQNVPRDEIDMMTHLNAMRFFKFDPFKYIDKKDATVGALRKAAAHVDLTPMQIEPGAYKPIPKGKVMTAQDMADLGKEMGNALMKSQDTVPG
jgi:predicted TIM-barrel fold metal-dependent hydrolase